MNARSAILARFSATVRWIFAAALTGCATSHTAGPTPLSDTAWAAFQEAGSRANRLAVFNMEPLGADKRSELQSVQVVALGIATEFEMQETLSSGEAAKRGAKLWLGVADDFGDDRLSTGKPKAPGYTHREKQAGRLQDLLGGPGDSTGVAIAYLLYAPIGATIGAVSGAATTPNEFKIRAAVPVLSNAVASMDQLLAEATLSSLRPRLSAIHPEVLDTNQVSASRAAIQTSVPRVRLEGGQRRNGRLWLTVWWRADITSTGTDEPIYSIDGLWQSDQKLKLLDWAENNAQTLRQALDEACRQIAAVIAEMIVP